MKTENAIVLGLSAIAVYFIVKSTPGLAEKAKAAIGLGAGSNTYLDANFGTALWSQQVNDFANARLARQG